MSDASVLTARSLPVRLWEASLAWTRVYVRHPDPLVENTNWVAILIGTHLPFWPLYVLWSAGRQAMPTALWTAALAPVFLVIPLAARRSGLLARIATPLAGIANTVFTIWVLGAGSGTAVFLAPSTMLIALSFRRAERWWMIGLATLALATYYVIPHLRLRALHDYDAEATRSLLNLNVISVGVLAMAFGWLQCGVYRRMERSSSRT